MRASVALTLILLSACASDKLALAPSAGVDLTGRWKLNEADSDDPQRLIQAQFNAAANAQNSPAGGGGSGGGSGGRGGRSGRGGPGGIGGPGGPGAPMMPSVSVMSESLRWPGKELEIKQVAGVVAFTSEGINQLCQPGDADKKRHHGMSSDHEGRPEGRDEPPGGRDGPPPRCGWADKVLIVQGGDPDADHPPYEETYSISDDGRLVEVVGFKGGRSNGFTMSRVWDRVESQATPK
jgi:hypothetical protein